MLTSTPLTHLVTTSYRESVRAYWCDHTGTVWESRLKPYGFTPPAVMDWPRETKTLRATYYLPDDNSPAEPVLYGVTSTHLWVRTLHSAPQCFPLPGWTSDDADFVLSMTGRHSWVVDTVHDGFLRRWNGHTETAFEGPVVYRMVGVDAVRVFGTCASPHLCFPQPLFMASDGLVYLWNSRQGPISCVTAGESVVHAHAGARLRNDCLVYTANQDGHIVATRQVATGGNDPRWGGFRVISRTFQPYNENLVPLLQPASPPALFTVSDTELTLLSPPSTAYTAATTLGAAAWIAEKTPLASALERPRPTAAEAT
ncbi:hypothetical protein [Streptomyces murinus]|uniref:hypothetical protein n=1 Tax=Streptomyces murinus TaxID=33900 RepID=UPI003F48A9F9